MLLLPVSTTNARVVCRKRDVTKCYDLVANIGGYVANYWLPEACEVLTSNPILYNRFRVLALLKVHCAAIGRLFFSTKGIVEKSTRWI